jgi:quinol monooxygenase YgiN
MSRVSIWAQLEAKPGKERELEEFLKSAQPLAVREAGTLSWYAIKMGPGKYGIFDTFADENGRNAHLNGEIAKALFAKAGELLAKPPGDCQARNSCGEIALQWRTRRPPLHEQLQLISGYSQPSDSGRHRNRRCVRP